jgi:hypothetical protein
MFCLKLDVGPIFTFWKHFIGLIPSWSSVLISCYFLTCSKNSISTNVSAFGDLAPRSLVEVYRRLSYFVYLYLFNDAFSVTHTI